MFVVGLTGGIGSGKTTIAHLFQTHFGIAIYNSDMKAKLIVDNNIKIQKQIINLLGEQAFEYGKYNRSFVAEQVFTNPNLLKELNAIIHPAVKEDFQQWISVQKSDYVLKESAILIESKAYKLCNCIINVKAPLQQRIERLKIRDKINSEFIKIKIKNQLTDEYREKFADFVIKNDNYHNISKQINNIHAKILKMIK